jgi:hypothetical protein
MPMLKIDDTDVAQIDDNLAEKLRRMVSRHGIGISQKPAGFQTSVRRQLDKPRPPVETFVITLEFHT